MTPADVAAALVRHVLSPLFAYAEGEYHVAPNGHHTTRIAGLSAV